MANISTANIAPNMPFVSGADTKLAATQATETMKKSGGA